jgi:hypothetical protein
VHGPHKATYDLVFDGAKSRVADDAITIGSCAWLRPAFAWSLWQTKLRHALIPTSIVGGLYRPKSNPLVRFSRTLEIAHDDSHFDELARLLD